jgi:heme-degrading monooxygenase HmoA
MHLILESGGGRKPGLLEMLMGRKPGFSKDETKITIAHELTHALDDQHHDLDKMLKAIKKNDDAEIALSALIEGDATLAMMAAGQEDWQGEVTALLPEDALGQTFRLMMPFLSMGSGASLRSAPPIISQSLLFPYLQGLVFCAHLTNTGGWKAIDTAYGQPPRSTEQVIHPEKYDTARDEPTTINLGTLAAPAGWKEIRRNVLGEMQIAVLLRSQKGNEAAAGWDGDQYVAFEGPDDKLGLVWFSTWDSEDDAKQFANALARYQHSRFGGDKPAKDADVYTREREHTVFMVERRGLDVLAIEGFDEQTTQAIAKSGWEAKKTNLDSTRSSSDRR